MDIIVGAHSSNRAIGAKGKIPWKCRADMQFFKEITTSTQDPSKVNAVIMGRTTYQSLGKPLANRVNVVLSKKTVTNLVDGVFFTSSFCDAVELLGRMTNVENIFVIGGESVYKQALIHPKCRRIYLNLVHVACDLSEADTFFPEVDTGLFELVETKAIDPSVTSHVFRKY
jgi:dihydrofolate reductase